MKTKRFAMTVLLLLIVFAMTLSACASTPVDGDGTTTTTTTATTSATSADDGTTTADSTTTTESTTATETTTNGTESTTTTTQSTTKATSTSKSTTSTTKTPTTTTTTKPVVSSDLKQSDYVKNAAVWSTPMLGTGFYFEVEMTSIGTMNKQLLKNSIKKLDVGEYVSQLSNVKAAEWGYSVLNLPTGSVDGAGRVMQNVYLDNKANITTRKDALAKIKEFIMGQYVRGAANPWYSMNGHHSWHHYAGEWGFDVLASEIGENIHGYQFHVAMNRGAARQYNRAWAIDFSSWHGAGILDYSSTPIWGNYSSPTNGHSLNLVERSFVMSYMSGADSVVAEAGAAISFYSELDSNGLYKISPYGEVCRDFNAFTKANPDVGITYTPIAIALDYYHGMDRHSSGNYVFGKFAYNSGDQMTHTLVDMIWPGTWAVERNGNETGALSNGPYGDSFDFLLQNASQEVLNTYPAIILSGDITLSNEEVARYKAYVKQGGTLVLNTAYLKQFPEYTGTLSNNRYDVKDGAGKVIVYGPDYSTSKLDSIIRELLDELMPISVSSNIQHIVNVKDGYMYVTLMNSDGVTKTSHGTTTFNANKDKTVTVKYEGDLKIKGVKDIYNGNRSIKMTNNSCSISLDAGDIVILEIAFS